MCGFSQYALYAKRAIKITNEQVGSLEIDSGIAGKGLIIRHLILPHYDSQAMEILQWIKESLGTMVPIGIMRQYFSAYKAVQMNDIDRRVIDSEYNSVVREAEKQGLLGWTQEKDYDISMAGIS